MNRELKKQCGLLGHKESRGKRNEREMRRRIDVSNRCHHIVFGYTGTEYRVGIVRLHFVQDKWDQREGGKQKFDAEPHGWSSPSTADA